MWWTRSKSSEEGVTVILIEHNMKVLLDVADRVVVLSFGTKIAEGNPKEEMNKPEVIEAYLGTEMVLTMLELKNLWIRYGKKAAVRKLSLQVNKGDFVTILGANGAGKSTTLNAISGLVKVKKGQGEILFKGEKINGLKPGKIAARGIIQIPEGRKLFPLLTVRENLMVGAYLRKDRKGVQKSMDKALALFPDLKDKLGAESRELSGGQQQKWWPLPGA